MQPQHGTCKAGLSPVKQCTCQAYATAYGQQVSLVAAGCLFDQDSRIHLAHGYARRHNPDNLQTSTQTDIESHNLR